MSTSLINKLRTNYGLLALAVVSLVVVPLDFTCAILTSESPMQHDSFVRMSHARDGMWWLFVILQIGAGLLLVSRLGTHKALRAKLRLFVGLSLTSAVAMLICGLGLLILAEHGWYKLAEALFS
jgi:hypothetical protein